MKGHHPALTLNLGLRYELPGADGHWRRFPLSSADQFSLDVDVSLIKNTRFRRSESLQIRVEMFNATNTRNFGIPDSRVNSAGFLNQWATDGGARRIWGAIRYTF